MIELKNPALLFTQQKLYTDTLRSESEIAWPENGNVLLLYAHPNKEWKEEWEQMLTKLTSACGFDFTKDCWKINVAEHSLDLAGIQKRFIPKLILIFGEGRLSRNLGIVPLHYPIHLSGSVIIRTLELNKLVNDKSAKTKLWEALQFGLNLAK